MPTPKRRRRLAAALLAAVSAALLAACSHPAGKTASATTSVNAALTKGCDADYCAPASWDTGPSPSPFPEIKSFREPVNVVLSARSTVSLSVIQKALGDWKSVSAATRISVSGIRMMCISTEQADVTGAGYVPMQRAWRLDGCLHGNELSVSGKEGHVRLWHQPVPGSRGGAWFIAASYETMCVVRNGALQPVKSNKLYAALHSSSTYHCVNGGPGSITSAYPNGYDDGAVAFAADITKAARAKGWHVSQQTLTVPRAARAGEGGVPFNDNVDLLTITS